MSERRLAAIHIDEVELVGFQPHSRPAIEAALRNELARLAAGEVTAPPQAVRLDAPPAQAGRAVARAVWRQIPRDKGPR